MNNLRIKANEIKVFRDVHGRGVALLFRSTDGEEFFCDVKDDEFMDFVELLNVAADDGLLKV